MKNKKEKKGVKIAAAPSPIVSVVQNAPSAVACVFKSRSTYGFERFLDLLYSNKKTKGAFRNAKSYAGNLEMFIKHVKLNSETFHKLGNAELHQVIKFFEDLPPKHLSVNSLKNLHSTCMAYKEYVRFTKGLYTQVRIAA